MHPELLRIEQRTSEWYEARLGKATASRFKDILATLKSGGESAARKNYRAELVVERLTGMPIERYRSAAMDWGTETEDLARLEYTLKTGNAVEEVGIFVHEKLAAGASPDGLVGKDGLVEIKCREVANHIQMLRSGEVSNDYTAQIQGQLWLTDRKWCDFISFAPELPENAQLFIKRVPRDEGYIKNLASEVTKFLAEVDAEVAFVKEYK